MKKKFEMKMSDKDGQKNERKSLNYLVFDPLVFYFVALICCFRSWCCCHVHNNTKYKMIRKTACDLEKVDNTLSRLYGKYAASAS